MDPRDQQGDLLKEVENLLYSKSRFPGIIFHLLKYHPVQKKKKTGVKLRNRMNHYTVKDEIMLTKIICEDTQSRVNNKPPHCSCWESLQG